MMNEEYCGIELKYQVIWSFDEKRRENLTKAPISRCIQAYDNDLAPKPREHSSIRCLGNLWNLSTAWERDRESRRGDRIREKERQREREREREGGGEHGRVPLFG